MTPAYTSAPGDTVAIDAAARILANVERVVVGKHDEIALIRERCLELAPPPAPAWER